MRRFRSRAGSQVVEFALILPLLLILVFGVIDFGIAMYDKAVVTNASREGARAGIVFAPTRLTNADIVNVVNTYCQNYLITFGAPSTVQTTVARTGLTSGSTLTVTVQYHYDYSVISYLLPGLGALNLQAQTVMRME